MSKQGSILVYSLYRGLLNDAASSSEFVASSVRLVKPLCSNLTLETRKARIECCSFKWKTHSRELVKWMS